MFSDLLRAWHGDLPWIDLARRAERGLAALVEARDRGRAGAGDPPQHSRPDPFVDPDHVSLEDVARAEARFAARQATFRIAADGLASLRGESVARWPDLLAHPAAQEHTAELAELLLENSARCLADDPRLAAAFAALAGLVRTRGPEHDERPADRIGKISEPVPRSEFLGRR